MTDIVEDPLEALAGVARLGDGTGECGDGVSKARTGRIGTRTLVSGGSRLIDVT